MRSGCGKFAGTIRLIAKERCHIRCKGWHSACVSIVSAGKSLRIHLTSSKFLVRLVFVFREFHEGGVLVETFDVVKSDFGLLAHDIAFRASDPESAHLSSAVGRFPPRFRDSNFLTLPPAIAPERPNRPGGLVCDGAGGHDADQSFFVRL